MVKQFSFKGDNLHFCVSFISDVAWCKKKQMKNKKNQVVSLAEMAENSASVLIPFNLEVETYSCSLGNVGCRYISTVGYIL